MRTGEASLTLDNFRVDNDTKRLLLDMYDKIALYILLVAKYGVGIKGIYVSKDAVKIFFDTKYVTKMFFLVWGDLSALWTLGREQVIYNDHIFKN